MVSEKETVQTQEAPKPKIEESPEFKEALQTAIRQGTSKYQQQAAEARRDLKRTTAQVQTLTEQFEQARRDTEVARLAGDDEDAASRIKEQVKFRDEIEKRHKQLEEREQRVQEIERRASVKL